MPKVPLLTSLRAMLFAVMGVMPVAAPASAFSVSNASDAYAEVRDPGLYDAFLAALAAAGESSSGKISQLPVTADAFSNNGQLGRRADQSVVFYIVQDRGLPHGDTYPTYVFKTGNDGIELDLIVSTTAGKRIYYAGPETLTGCLLSANKAYSDVCLVDAGGEPAMDQPGLRDDVWTDLIRLFGL